MIRDGRHRTRITKRNQVTIPAAMLRDLGLVPGDEVEVEEDGGKLAVRKPEPAWDRWDEIVQGREIPHLTDEELRVAIREAAEDAATKRYLRSLPDA